MGATLLDTNVLSELMRKRPEPKVASFFETCARPIVSVLAFHEMIYGVERLSDELRKARMMERIALFREQFHHRIIPIDGHIAESAGRLRGGASRVGRVLPPLDSLIAATAMACSATLATRNLKDFVALEIPLIDPWQVA